MPHAYTCMSGLSLKRHFVGFDDAVGKLYVEKINARRNAGKRNGAAVVAAIETLALQVVDLNADYAFIGTYVEGGAIDLHAHSGFELCAIGDTRRQCAVGKPLEEY